jgi:heme/copper-type cytochrome/quinol oxidase subunit 3
VTLLLYTVILPSSSTTVIHAHYSLVQGNSAGVICGLIATSVLATIFAGFQQFVYYNASFLFGYVMYGSTSIWLQDFMDSMCNHWCNFLNCKVI